MPNFFATVSLLQMLFLLLVSDESYTYQKLGLLPFCGFSINYMMYSAES